MLGFVAISQLVLFCNNFLPLFSFPLICCFFLVSYILSSSFYFNSCSYMVSSYFQSDSVSLIMTFLLVVVMFLSFLYAFSFKSSFSLNLSFFYLLVFCFFVFVSNNYLMLFFFYEASLIPILYVIIKWGSYPERSVSSFMLLTYTVFLSAPFLVVLVYSYLNTASFNFDLLSFSYSYSYVMTLIVFMAFAVKLPMYGLHYWLPMAHVEAPTFGSVILASILLKLGGVGLLRFSSLMNTSGLFVTLMSYLMFFSVFTCIVCCFQSDLKRLIAYSSVAHMMVIPILSVSSTLLGNSSLLLVMFFHGVSSSLLFMLVGILYSIFSSRQLVVLRGLLLVSPLVSFFSILTFFYTLSAPPFPSFVSEVFFLMSSYFLTPHLVWVFLLFVFLGLLYNLNWLVSSLFSPISTSFVYIESNIKFSMIMPFFFFMFFTLLFIPLFTLL